MKGRILDDDTIITTLENLKREAAEVTRKVEETDIVMQEVETVSQQYLPLSTACSSIYFTMESLKQVTPQGPRPGEGTRCRVGADGPVASGRYTSCTSTRCSSSWTSTTTSCTRTPT